MAEFPINPIKELSEELKESEARFRAYVEQAADALFVHDFQGRFIDFNTKACISLGYSREELSDMSVFDVETDFNLELAQDAWSRIQPNQSFILQGAQRRKDGSTFPVEISFGCFDINGVRHYMGVVRDITQRKLAEQKIQDQQARLNGLIDAAMDAIVSTDENQNIIIFNHAAEQMFGYSADGIIGQHLDMLIPIRFRRCHGKYVVDFGKTGISARTMNTLGSSYALRANGEEFPFEASISRVTVSGKVMYTAILRDISFRKHTENELRVAAAAFDSQEGMVITDANSVILRVNHAFTEITGYSMEEAVGQTPRLFKSGLHNQEFYRAMWKSINLNGKWQGEVWDRRKNGEIYPKWLTISAVKDIDGVVTHYIGSHLDITDRKTAEEQILNLAFYDPLTHLANRRLLQDRLGQALVSSARCKNKGALLFIDLDNFKNVNDTLGHIVGDLLLQQVALRLTSCVRESDTVARLGGDEFVVMLEELDTDELAAAAQTEAIAEKILTQLNHPYQLNFSVIHNTPSIGIALFGEHKLDSESLFQQADIALYHSKRAGRNTLCFFDPKMQEIINARTKLETDLRNAIENQQFQLFYQVQTDSTYKPVGAEALIRWIHPEHGMVSPAQFIPLAEESGLILLIGQWVLSRACIQLKAWEQNRHVNKLILSVNVSARQFRQADFVSQVQNLVLHYAINSDLLKLELTETMLIDDIEDTIAKMNALKSIGVRLSLDDFGTGYSSLQYLKQLPLNELKIDQSFVKDIGTNDKDQAIVKTIIAMAQSLDLDVIAEGVETQAQLAFITKHGCQNFQGYLFGKPMPIEQFEDLLEQGK